PPARGAAPPAGGRLARALQGAEAEVQVAVIRSRGVSESGTEPFEQPRAFVTQFRLVVDGAERAFVSSSGRAVIGTHAGCDVVVDDRTVSRFHCEITVRDGRARVRDLDSKNGTLVDGVAVLESFLHDGARLTVGHTTLQFGIGGGEVAIPLSRGSQFGLL